jgi:hypothetical protein
VPRAQISLRDVHFVPGRQAPLGVGRQVRACGRRDARHRRVLQRAALDVLPARIAPTGLSQARCRRTGGDTHHFCARASPSNHCSSAAESAGAPSTAVAGRRTSRPADRSAPSMPTAARTGSEQASSVATHLRLRVPAARRAATAGRRTLRASSTRGTCARVAVRCGWILGRPMRALTRPWRHRQGAGERAAWAAVCCAIRTRQSPPARTGPRCPP